LGLERAERGIDDMALWRLSPRHLSDPNWEASSHRAVAIVRAPDHKTARAVAEAAFGVKTRFKAGAGILVPPWNRPDLVDVERITDERFEGDGPSAVLSPSFERELRARKT
jgi:hypothetical protein